MNLAFLRLAALSLSLAAGASFAADIAPANDKFTPARTKIAEKNWAGAIDELKKVNDPASAEWNNLMGYSLRKADPANAGEAETFYNEALRIDPKHKGANEYLGEAYLMVGNLPKAKEQLATLDKLCFFSCKEYSELKKSIAEYEAKPR